MASHDTPRPGWGLLIEAGAAMIAASVAIRIVPFRRLAAAMSAPRSADGEASGREAGLIRRAVAAWARRLPWRTLCFEQGLAAHWLLRRRGLTSTLHYGAATIDGTLKAHVWVKSGSVDVVGCDNAGNYALLSRYPE